MLPARFDPFNDIREWERRFFPQMNTFYKEGEENATSFRPAVNTREGEYAYHVEVDLPGVKKEDITVDIKGNTLTISGERKTREEVKENDYYKCESTYGKFQRSFTLPEGIDHENLTASAEDGVLEIVIPKSKIETTRKIEIK